MSKPATALLAASLFLSAQAATRDPYLPHPPTREKGPTPLVNYYHAVAVPTWRGPAHPPTLDWGPGAIRPHVVNDQVLGRKTLDHPPTRDWGPDR